MLGNLHGRLTYEQPENQFKWGKDVVYDAVIVNYLTLQLVR